ncbi:hypothetical protein JP75_09780 [Devosia riboflavina]|uniref:Uncharacterized protein n=1 Tax=Devosia riboflavina TaxID=46914 RepID=A0A087M2S4_9HYPH|nr:hypothetical protein JP75_09780 [Devosia riboflavina]
MQGAAILETVQSGRPLPSMLRRSEPVENSANAGDIAARLDFIGLDTKGKDALCSVETLIAKHLPDARPLLQKARNGSCRFPVFSGSDQMNRAQSSQLATGIRSQRLGTMASTSSRADA